MIGKIIDAVKNAIGRKEGISSGVSTPTRQGGGTPTDEYIDAQSSDITEHVKNNPDLYKDQGKFKDIAAEAGNQAGRGLK